MKSKVKLQEAVADLKVNQSMLKTALVKEQPLWKQAVYYLLSMALMFGLSIAVIMACYFAAVWLMPQTIQLVTMSIGVTGDATVMDVALLIGVPSLMLAVTYGILLARVVTALIRLYKPGMARVKSLLRFRQAEKG